MSDEPEHWDILPELWCDPACMVFSSCPRQCGETAGGIHVSRGACRHHFWLSSKGVPLDILSPVPEIEGHEPEDERILRASLPSTLGVGIVTTSSPLWFRLQVYHKNPHNPLPRITPPLVEVPRRDPEPQTRHLNKNFDSKAHKTDSPKHPKSPTLNPKP